MSSRKLKSKPCGCPPEKYSWLPKETKETQGNLVIIHKFESFECSVHLKPWGQRRGEEIITITEKPIKDRELTDREIQFFRAVFPSLWDGKISAIEWQETLKKKMKIEKVDRITESWIQKGIIYKKAIFHKTSIEPKTYIHFTDSGRLDLKNRLNFSTIDERKAAWLDKIQKSIEIARKNPDMSDMARETISKIILDEQCKILHDDPGFHTEEKHIVPTNSLVNKPKYDIILLSLCEWLRIWKPILTVRELSARSVMGIARDYDNDPSKVIEEYWHDFEDVVYYNGKVAIEDLGLMNKLKFVHYSGSLAEVKSDVKGDTFSTVSNYYILHHPGLSFTSPARNLLVVENLAAFFHASVQLGDIDPSKWFIVYGGGQVDSFLPSIIYKLIRDNNFQKVAFWVDNDLGGLNILTTFLRYLKNREIDKKKCDTIAALFKIPPAFLTLAFDKHQETEIASLIEKSPFQVVKDIGQYIIANGSIEQEALLTNLKEFLEFNEIC
jgi:hypothetical protein